MPKAAKNTSGSGWRRMKQIAEKAMDNGKFTISDVKNDLSKMRSTYKK